MTGYTGTNFNRPGFQRMIKDIEEGKIDLVITKDLSRLGRDYIDTGYYIQKYFPNNNIRYISILDNIDTIEDGGMDDMAPFKGVMNDMYSKDISKKVRSALESEKKAGKFVGSTTAYGYMKDPNDKHKLIINEKEAEVVKLIFRLYIEGNGLTRIAKILTEKGIEVPGKSRNCRKNDRTQLYDCWKQTTISRILRNQVYIGILEQGKRKKVNYKSKIRVVVPKEDRIICKNTHESIIDEDTFFHVQELLQKNISFKNSVHDYLLKGLLYCGDCGAKMYVTYSNYALKKYGEYRYTTICYTYSKYYNQCTRHSNNIKILEPLIIANIKKVCKSYIKQNLSEELINLAQKDKETNIRMLEYEKKIKEIDKRFEDISLCLKNLYIDKVKGILSESDYINLSKDFSAEKEKLIEDRKKYINLKNKNNIEKNNRKKIEELANEFITLEKPTKELLTKLIDKITITEDNIVTIYFKFKELNSIKQEGNQITECKTINKRNKKVS